MQILPIAHDFSNGLRETQMQNAQCSSVEPRSLLGGNSMLIKVCLDSLTSFHVY